MRWERVLLLICLAAVAPARADRKTVTKDASEEGQTGLAHESV